jgi:hypothetical protein
MMVNFRSCRDSGLTWWALAGLDVIKLQRRAGHDSLQTTSGYVKIAEEVGGNFGTPFAPLPAALVCGPKLGNLGVFTGQIRAKQPARSTKRCKTSLIGSVPTWMNLEPRLSR